jgi:hypothetical protein
MTHTNKINSPYTDEDCYLIYMNTYTAVHNTLCPGEICSTLAHSDDGKNDWETDGINLAARTKNKPPACLKEIAANKGKKCSYKIEPTLESE